MGEEIDSAVIRKTQEILGSIIKKPALTEKYLKKPPFRFLHDIIKNVIRSSGFYKGLYTPEELQSENVTDKDSKINFLQKAIDVLGLVTNQSINLKPSKVVAGHEPQKTNLFLQSLGTAVKNKLDSKEAVEAVLNGKSQGSPSKVARDRRASVDKKSKGSSEKSHSRSLTKTIDPGKKSTTSSSQSKEKPKDAEKPKDKTRESKKDRDKSKERSKHKSEESSKKSPKSAPKPKESPPDNGGDGEVQVNEDQIQNGEKVQLMNGDAHTNDETPGIEANVNEDASEQRSHRPRTSRSARPPSARSKRTKPGDDGESLVQVSNGPVTATVSYGVSNGEKQVFENSFIPSLRPPSARPPSARPSSSRPAPPRIKVRHVVENEEPILRPATAKPVENVILDQGHQSDDEDAFLVMESEATEQFEVQSTKTLPAETPDEDKGSLVKKLLETKKDLEGGSQTTPTKKVEIDRSQMEHVRKGERDSASRELGLLRTSVQSLSRTAVPLGRTLDFLQEDLDSMRIELRTWKEEHERNVVLLRKEQSATESMLEPLQAQLDDFEQLVHNQLEANSALKASITRNDERIQRMLASVNSKS